MVDENVDPETPVEVDNRMAVASYRLGILSVLSLVMFCSTIAYWQIAMEGEESVVVQILWGVFLYCALIFFPIPAIILSLVSRYKISKSPVPMKGRSLAEAGRNIAFVNIGLTLFAMIYIPGLLRSHIQVNESAAIGNLRTITYAQEDYRKAHGTYAGSFAELTDATHGSAFLLGTWDEATPKTGYIFTLKSIDNGNCYETKANPVTPGRTGIRYFFSDCNGVIRYSVEGPADSTNRPIGE